MSLADVFAEGEAIQRMEVEYATWGHLYPEPGNVYEGEILFAWAGYGGDIVVLAAEFKGLEDSPRLYDDMCEMAAQQTERKGIEASQAYRWTGTYRVFKNGRCRFTGKTKVAAKLNGRAAR